MSWYTKIADKPNPGEIRSLELQIKMLKDKRDFLPKQIAVLEQEKANLPRQINSLEKQLDFLRRQSR